MRISVSCFRRFLPGVLPLLGLLLAGGCGRPAGQSQSASLPDTRVYIVRHGEKELAPGLPDPALTPDGRQRALALRDSLRQGPPLTGIFSTSTARTKGTAQPLAEVRQLPIQPYDAKQLAALAARIRREYRGQRVLVVGHSNTILETVEAFGAPRPVPTIGDDEYDYLLEVRLPQDSTAAATAVARRYGAVHH